MSAHSLNYSTYGKLETIGADLLIWKVSCTEDIEFRKPEVSVLHEGTSKVKQYKYQPLWPHQNIQEHLILSGPKTLENHLLEDASSC